MNIKKIVSISIILTFSIFSLFSSENEKTNPSNQPSDPFLKEEVKTYYEKNNDQKIQNHSFFFLTLEAIYGIPKLLGYGYRKQKGSKGYDYSVSINPIYLIKNKMKAYEYNFSSNYLKFFNPYKNNSFYFGLGYNFLGNHAPKKHFILFSPNLVYGKQYNTKENSSFMQLKINWLNVPLLNKGKNKLNLNKDNKLTLLLTPIINISLGFGF